MLNERIETKLMAYGVPADYVDRLVIGSHRDKERIDRLQSELDDVKAVKQHNFAKAMARFYHVLAKTGMDRGRYRKAMHHFLNGEKMYDVCSAFGIPQSLFMRYLQLNPRYVESKKLYIKPNGSHIRRRPMRHKQFFSDGTHRTKLDDRLRIKHIGMSFNSYY